MESYWNRVGQPNGRAFEQTQGDSEEQGSLVCCSLGPRSLWPGVLQSLVQACWILKELGFID